MIIKVKNKYNLQVSKLTPCLLFKISNKLHLLSNLSRKFAGPLSNSIICALFLHLFAGLLHLITLKYQFKNWKTDTEGLIAYTCFYQRPTLVSSFAS